jgi:6-hydroxytryprostatin B O-methyltransferase
VPLGGTISTHDLAKATGLSEDILTRTVRYAIMNGVFEESKPGQIGHSAASATLARNKNLHDMTIFNSGFSTRMICCLADALKAQNQQGANPPDAAFNVAYPGYTNLFDYMGNHPQASQEYFNYLDGRSQISRYSAEKLVSSWDWQSVACGTIIDVRFVPVKCLSKIISADSKFF